jgi:hypothetical protein
MLVAEVTRALRRVLGLTVTLPINTSVSASQHTNRFRPVLELVEDRVTPATFNWTGAEDTTATNTANWQITNGSSQTGLPGAGDDVFFTAAYSRDCTGLTSTTGSFNSLHLQSGYTGTVTLGGALPVGTLELASGAISQQDSITGNADDLTVSGNLSWTGGTLNSSPVLANVNINGGTATFAPTGAGTVASGSTINLNSGDIATMWAGTLAMSNNAVFNINANAKMFVAPGTGQYASLKVQTVGVTQINITTGAWLEVQSGQFGNAANRVPLKNSGGSLVLDSGTVAIFAGAVDNSPAGGPSISQTTGATYIAADASLESPQGMVMSGGALQIKTGAKPQGFAGNIIGYLQISGGDIGFDPGSGGGYRGWGEFWVTGNVDWTGGTYHPYVSAQHDGAQADLWYVTGTFKISQFVVVAPTAIWDDGVTGNPPSKTEWQLFKSDTLIRLVAGNNDPTAPTGYTFVKDGNNPSRWWDLKSN